MPRPPRRGGAPRPGAPRPIDAAFDEARFGATRTLNLRESLPTAAEAVQRAEAWLRTKQVERAGDVLVITGRGNQSEGKVGVVREAVARLLTSLRRRGVVTSVQEHTAGSFVVRLAPMRALFESGPRHREPGHVPPPPADPATLAGLAPATRARLRRLATLELESLGMHHPSPAFIDEEMRRQFAALAATLGAGADSEARLAAAVEQAIHEYEDRDA